jgi:DNA-binding ferritin-like protein (Dps family)
LIPIEKAYDAITTPARRRKIVVIKRQTSDPKALQNARNLGKELFSEMGPDGDDALYDFLQTKLNNRQLALSSYKPLADTGDYPGKEEVANGLFLIKKLLACDGSYKFIDEFNTHKNDLLDFADNFRDLEQFYEYQKPTWDKLRREYRRFRLNQLELERDTQAASALNRMQEILRAPSPYGLIKEAEGLITTVGTVNTALITESRKEAVEKIAGYLSQLTTEVELVKGNDALKTTCVMPLESLLSRVGTESSIAHITQARAEALKEYDAAVKRIEEFAKKEAEANKEKGQEIFVKKQRVIEPAKLMKSPYLETTDDVKDFINTLGEELDKAIANKERIQIR